MPENFLPAAPATQTLQLKKEIKGYEDVRLYLYRVNSVSDDTQHIETRHDGLRQVHVVSKGQGGVVPAACTETSTET